jgi:hypothetical protein
MLTKEELIELLVQDKFYFAMQEADLEVVAGEIRKLMLNAYGEGYSDGHYGGERGYWGDDD